jgi:Mad3/BUB1 homology region 1
VERYRNDQRYLKVCAWQFTPSRNCIKTLVSVYYCSHSMIAHAKERTECTTSTQTAACLIGTVLPRALSVYLYSSVHSSAMSFSQLHFQLHTRYKPTAHNEVFNRDACAQHTHAHIMSSSMPALLRILFCAKVVVYFSVPCLFTASLTIANLCCHAVTHIHMLAQVWIAYADCLTNSGELFKFLYKNEIGTGLALFWIAWAWVAEYAGDFPLADKVNKICTFSMLLQPYHVQ